MKQNKLVEAKVVSSNISKCSLFQLFVASAFQQVRHFTKKEKANLNINKIIKKNGVND